MGLSLGVGCVLVGCVFALLVVSLARDMTRTVTRVRQRDATGH